MLEVSEETRPFYSLNRDYLAEVVQDEVEADPRLRVYLNELTGLQVIAVRRSARYRETAKETFDIFLRTRLQSRAAELREEGYSEVHISKAKKVLLCSAINLYRHELMRANTEPLYNQSEWYLHQKIISQLAGNYELYRILLDNQEYCKQQSLLAKQQHTLNALELFDEKLGLRIDKVKKELKETRPEITEEFLEQVDLLLSYLGVYCFLGTDNDVGPCR